MNVMSLQGSTFGLLYIDPMVVLHAAPLIPILGLVLADKGKEPRERGCWHANPKHLPAAAGQVVKSSQGLCSGAREIISFNGRCTLSHVTSCNDIISGPCTRFLK